MVSASLTKHDLFVLEKIKDPEAGPSAPLLIDSSLPRDPHITDEKVYQTVVNLERSIISSIQQIEFQIAGLKQPVPKPLVTQYLDQVKTLDGLIDNYASYASARNNRAQALRRICGGGMLVRGCGEIEADALPLDINVSDSDLVLFSSRILGDLTDAINLLTPSFPFMGISPQAAKTLSQAYTQRGAIYHLTAKYLLRKGAELRILDNRPEADWETVDFEEHASRDFMLGGRYGNEIAKALAVSANPTAKLCGEMVREAMKKEYAAGAPEAV